MKTIAVVSLVMGVLLIIYGLGMLIEATGSGGFYLIIGLFFLLVAIVMFRRSSCDSSSTKEGCDKVEFDKNGSKRNRYDCEGLNGEGSSLSKIIGIDLGTTNSCMTVMENGKPVVIPNAEGNRKTPSVVAFPRNGEVLVGQCAKKQVVTNTDRTVQSIKREMGTLYKVKIGDKTYSPQEITAMILQKMKADAEDYLSETVNQAVITVPACFSDSQRQATKDAGKIAGLEVLRIINEPTAASLAYGLLAYGLDNEADQKILIFDLGGGSFDVSILEIGEGVFEVLATNGNNRLGGDDFDQKVVDWMIQEFENKEGINLRKDKTVLQRLREAAEKTKIELSSNTSTSISLPYLTADASGPKHLDMTITREKFNELTSDLVRKTEEATRIALADAALNPQNIDKILLVGGSTRIPAVQASVKKMFGKEPFKGINPDECVAIGAAIQAAVLSGDVTGLLLLDVTPLSLGIETMGGVFTKIIERNTTIPTKKSQVFSTAADGQTQIEVHVLQGEKEMTRYNKTLGKFILDGIPPAPRGTPQIEVSFDIDVNGIVNVYAKDKGTNREQHITITASTNLTEEEIDKAAKAAKIQAAEYKARREEVEARNKSNSIIYL